MKHILLITLLIVSAFFGFSQSCTPDAQYAGSPAGLYPAGPLGPTCELTAPKTIVSLTDTFITGLPFVGSATLYITEMRINAVTGLPAGLQLGTDVMATADQDGPWGYWVNTGSIPNQTAAFGCAYVYGTGGDWDAAVGGGPNNDGVYPLEFEVDAFVADANPAILPLIGGAQWVSQIDPASGGGSFFILDTLVIPADYANISTTISGDSNIEPGTTYTYSVPQDPNVSYNWSVTNGTIQSGQGTNEVTIIWNGSGSIDVNLTDGGCQGTDDLTVTAITTGLDEIAGINASVYPNPNNGMFNLQLDNPELLDVRVIDVSGKLHQSLRLQGFSLYQLDLTDLPAGVYILELETGTGMTFKRLIKQ